jgi:hypothetical protein
MLGIKQELPEHMAPEAARRLVICKFTGLMIGKSGPHLLYLPQYAVEKNQERDPLNSDVSNDLLAKTPQPQNVTN